MLDIDQKTSAIYNLIGSQHYELNDALKIVQQRANLNAHKLSRQLGRESYLTSHLPSDGSCGDYFNLIIDELHNLINVFKHGGVGVDGNPVKGVRNFPDFVWATIKLIEMFEAQTAVNPTVPYLKVHSFQKLGEFCNLTPQQIPKFLKLLNQSRIAAANWVSYDNGDKEKRKESKIRFYNYSSDGNRKCVSIGKHETYKAIKRDEFTSREMLTFVLMKSYMAQVGYRTFFYCKQFVFINGKRIQALDTDNLFHCKIRSFLKDIKTFESKGIATSFKTKERVSYDSNKKQDLVYIALHGFRKADPKLQLTDFMAKKCWGSELEALNIEPIEGELNVARNVNGYMNVARNVNGLPNPSTSHISCLAWLIANSKEENNDAHVARNVKSIKHLYKDPGLKENQGSIITDKDIEQSVETARPSAPSLEVTGFGQRQDKDAVNNLDGHKGETDSLRSGQSKWDNKIRYVDSNWWALDQHGQFTIMIMKYSEDIELAGVSKEDRDYYRKTGEVLNLSEYHRKAADDAPQKAKESGVSMKKLRAEGFTIIQALKMLNRGQIDSRY